MTEFGNDLARIGETILTNLDSMNAARERALAETRQIIRLSARSIRAVHRGDFDEAGNLLGTGRAMQADLSASLADFPDIYWSGYMRAAQKEFAEASITLALLADRALPTPDALGVEDADYLNGLGEACGELRRHTLDAMRQGNLDRAETMLERMNDIYDLLVTVDYPDAVTGGLRRTTDLARSVLERTRGDLTIGLQQRALSSALERVEMKLDRVVET